LKDAPPCSRRIGFTGVKYNLGGGKAGKGQIARKRLEGMGTLSPQGKKVK